jgi:hypothetical protein
MHLLGTGFSQIHKYYGPTLFDLLQIVLRESYIK